MDIVRDTRNRQECLEEMKGRMTKSHEEYFQPLDRVMINSSNNVLVVDGQINQWVFAHDCNGRKYELDCVNSDVYRVMVGDF